MVQSQTLPFPLTLWLYIGADFTKWASSIEFREEFGLQDEKLIMKMFTEERNQLSSWMSWSQSEFNLFLQKGKSAPYWLLSKNAPSELQPLLFNVNTEFLWYMTGDRATFRIKRRDFNEIKE